MNRSEGHRSRRLRRAPPGADASNLTRASQAPSGPLRVVHYDGARFATERTTVAALGPWLKRGGIAWVDAEAPSAADLEALRLQLHLDALAIADAAHPPQRPHHADWPQFELLVLAGGTASGRLQQVSIFLADHWVLTIRETPDDLFAPVRQRLEERIGSLRDGSAALLVTALVGTLTDGLFERVERVREELEELEDQVLGSGQPRANALHLLRRRVLHLRRAVGPMLEAIRRASRWETRRWDADAQVHLREVGEDAAHLFELVEEAQTTAAALGDLYLSVLNRRTTGVITLLTVVSTLFLPMTFLGSLWGMNFKYMPELQWRYGYAFALTMIGLSAVGLLVYMKRQRWLRSMRGVWDEEG